MKEKQRIPLGIFPTPLMKLNHLSALLNKNVYIKRDDMCGVALGGNKVRKLEFLLADAINGGYDTIVTVGGAQSNHAMLTAACAKRLGLMAVLLLIGQEQEAKGNLILDKLLGARLVYSDIPHEQIAAEMEWLAAGLRGEGRKPYLIPLGGSNPLGSMGYISCLREMSIQAEAMNFDLSHIVCANGSGGTYSGLALGASVLQPETKVTGINIGAVEHPEETVISLMRETAEYLGLSADTGAGEIRCHNFCGEGYAISSREGEAAIRLLAQSEGIFLDPVYTGKAFAGMLDLLRTGYFDGDDNIVFLHSGGGAALFAIPMQYEE